MMVETCAGQVVVDDLATERGFAQGYPPGLCYAARDDSN